MVGRATFEYAGESAIVTGSTRGIGRGIARALAEHDADVLVVAEIGDEVDETVADLESTGEGTVAGVTADVADPDEVRAMAETAVETFGEVDLLVNNAAVWPMEESMVAASFEDWEHTVNVNLRSQFLAAQHVARHMIEADIEGSIINVTSQTGDRRAGGRGIYGVTNTAINGLTWRLAHDLAPEGIRVNAVSTAMTETSQLRYEAGLEAESATEETADDQPAEDATVDGSTAENSAVEDVLDEWGAELPMGRLGRPEDLADAVLYLASDRAAYVTGTVLRASGGGNLQ